MDETALPQTSATMIRIISMADQVDRRTQFDAHAHTTQLPWSYFDAHTRPMACLTDDKKAQMRIAGRTLTTGELGCYSSHVAIWKEFLASGQPQLLVLEDDVVVDWPYIEFLCRHDFRDTGIDYLRLFAKIPAPYRLMRSPFLSTYYHLVRYLDYALGTQAYLLTPEGASRLAAHCDIIRRPIDVEMGRVWDHSVPNYGILPSPVYERFGQSSIGSDRFPRRSLEGRDVVGWAIEKVLHRTYRLRPNPQLGPNPRPFLMRPAGEER